MYTFLCLFGPSIVCFHRANSCFRPKIRRQSYQHERVESGPLGCVGNVLPSCAHSVGGGRKSELFEKKLADGGKKVNRRWPKKIQTVEIFSKNANHIGKSQSWESVGKRLGRVGVCAGHVAQVSGGRIEVGRNCRNFVL